MWREYPTFQPNEIIVYLRKSQSDDASLTVEEVLSKHESDLRRWQEAFLDSLIPECNYYREVVSGESISARSEFQKVLKRIESPEIKACLVIDCARLGRPDTEEIGRITKLFRYTKTFVITPQRTFDLSEEWDREAFEREMMRGRDYLDYTKKVLKRGKEISARDGWYIHSIPVYGYKKVWIYEDKRRRPTLEIHEEEANIVRMIFDWYTNEGLGTSKICHRLNAMGIKSQQGKEWRKSSISHMLKNEHYLGKIVIKKRIRVNSVEDSEIVTHSMFNDKFEVVDGKHPAIISEEAFFKANNKMHKYPSVKPNSTLQNPFSSILRCSCGRTIQRKRSKHDFRYVCDEQVFCKNPSIGEKELLPAIIDSLKQNVYDLEARVADDDVTKKEKHTEYVSLLEKKLVDIENKEISLWDKYAEENMPKKIFDKLMTDCKEQKKKIEDELTTAYNNAPKDIDYKNAIQTLHQAIDSLSDDSVPAATKNNLLKSVIDKIVVHRERPIRMSKEEASEKGVVTNNGWYAPNISLDIHLRL